MYNYLSKYKIVSGHVILAYFCDLHSQLLPSWFTRRFPQLQSTVGLNLPCQAWENANFGLEDFQQMRFRVSFQKLELNGGVLVQVQVQVLKSERLSLTVGVINFRLK